jgi:ribosomal protein S18 acetylase RimI-like enzyme
MTATEIRRVGPHEASAYQALFLEGLRSAPTAFAADYEQEAVRSLDEVGGRLEREATYGAFRGGTLVGIVTLQAQPTPKRRHVGMVWNMYVGDGHRGTGVAAELFQHVLQVAEREVDQVDLYVAVENQRAWKFDRRFGFESYGVMPRALRVAGADYDALMMTKRFR